jgi:hypothetical protein
MREDGYKYKYSDVIQEIASSLSLCSPAKCEQRGHWGGLDRHDS